VRKILETQQITLESDFQGQLLGEVLLTPTRIYVKSLLALLRTVSVHALAHITGGGLLENVPRVIPTGLCASIDTQSWSLPPIFQWLQQKGNLSRQELYRTFNCGIGMVVCVPVTQVETALTCLQEAGETAWVIGEITQHATDRITLL
jgi:phosphoribosylformylglycinamidine cyclo-ligase